MDVRTGHVYRNEDGEQRLVVSVNGSGTKSVVVWRTSDPNLPKGVKAQGSATAASFGRWAVGARVATSADWRAFEEVEQRRKWRRSDSVAIRRIKQRRQRDRAAKEGT